MPLWEGVRPGTLQNTVLDWFFTNFEGSTGELAKFIYDSDTPYYKNRVASVLRALELKGKVINVPRGRWRIKTIPVEPYRADAQEVRIRDLEARLYALEATVKEL